jgi:branched-chain amino acid transport system substrate-binding protein
LLRRYRQAANLTQEELAERARLSAQAVGALERGDRRLPRKDTVDLLATALDLPPEERAAFTEAARPRGMAPLSPPVTPPVSPVSKAEGHLPSTVTDERPLVEALEALEAPGPVAPVRQAQASLRALANHLPSWSATLMTATRPYIARLIHLSKQPFGRVVSALLIIALAVSAIFLKGEVSGAPSGAPCGGALVIATDFPTFLGPGSPAAIAVQDAANLAIAQNHDLGGGYTLKAINYDDGSLRYEGWDPDKGAANVEQMVKNQCIIGMVGPFNSEVALAEIPIAARAGLVMISPDNTRAELTLRSYAEAQGINFDALHPPNKPNYYFRLVLNDTVQALADANLAYNLGNRSIFVLQQLDPYSELLSSAFTLAFEEKGGTVVSSANSLSDNDDSTDPTVIAAIAQQIETANPDAVYFAGWTDDIGRLKALLVSQGYTRQLITDDGVLGSPTYISAAGISAANNTYATVAGRDSSTFTSSAAERMFSDYHTQYPYVSLSGKITNTDDASIIPYSYDAAMVLITALKQLIAEGRLVTRSALAVAVQNIQYNGLTGPISFDANGDVTHGAFSICVVQQGQWGYFVQMDM